MIALVLGSAGERSVGAKESSVFPVERKHTLSVRKHRLRGVLNHLFARTGVRWHIEKNVPDVRVTIRFRRVSLQQGLRLIVRAAAKQVPNLTQSKDADEYVVKIREPVRCPVIFLPVPTSGSQESGHDGSLR